jgi:C-terminal processing protease CtpA/Prc
VEAIKAKQRTNFLVPKAEVLEGNVGYLRIDGFEATAVAGPTLVAAMRFLAHSDALIFDLRNNGGGDSASVALLMSYLLPPGTKLISFRDRAGGISQSWSQAYVPGGVWSLDKPVFVLTSDKTFSAAEEFAFNLQQHKRGRVVGVRSKGGANPGVIHSIDKHYRMFVPNEVAVGPVTGGNWEGHGVVPDVEVAPDAALQRATELAKEAIGARL